MGNLSGNGLAVKYKATRGTHEPGDTINDPKDWVEELMKGDREGTMKMFDNLTAAQQQTLEDCFGDGDMEVFRNVGNYEGWSGDATDDDYQEVYDKAQAALAIIHGQQ